MGIENKAPRNRTITLSEAELKHYGSKLIRLNAKAKVSGIANKVINQDLFEAIEFLPKKFVDILFVDPPYNLDKKFNSTFFKGKNINEYSDWIEEFIVKLIPVLKPTASIYFCGDWRSSTSIHQVLDKHFKVRSRITWEREKGRGAKANWKNNTEDIWFATVGNNYYFNLEAVKLKRKVIAPYRYENGQPKDWQEGENGGYRLTHPSNIWTDISVPFWSMPENTEHPTQKPEKLLAKIILASSKPRQLVFDPFLGSGTSAVVAAKLKRRFAGIEIDETYAATTLKRLEIAAKDKTIQGYHEGVFWERNSLHERKKLKGRN